MKSVLTIGNFDGVHIGHAALVRRAREIADGHHGKVIALTFEPHPATLLKDGVVPPRLTTFERRAELLRANGVDEVVCLTPTRELLSETAEQFVDELVNRFHPVAIVEGSDFRFGKGRRGDNELLARLGSSRGFAVHVVDPIEVDLSDQHLVRASSTLTRWLLSGGRVQDAARVLGRAYELSGPVVRGDRRGRELGFPTANIQTTCTLPMGGVYAAVGVLPDGREVPAAVSVGVRPTFDAMEPRLEAFLILGDQPSRGLPVPGLPEYGWTLTLRFEAFLREQFKFDSLEDLIRQMARDCERALQLLEVSCHAIGIGVTPCR